MFYCRWQNISSVFFVFRRLPSTVCICAQTHTYTYKCKLNNHNNNERNHKLVQMPTHCSRPLLHILSFFFLSLIRFCICSISTRWLSVPTLCLFDELQMTPQRETISNIFTLIIVIFVVAFSAKPFRRHENVLAVGEFTLIYFCREYQFRRIKNEIEFRNKATAARCMKQTVDYYEIAIHRI